MSFKSIEKQKGAANTQLADLDSQVTTTGANKYLH